MKNYGKIFLLQNRNIYVFVTYKNSYKINKHIVVFQYNIIVKDEKDKDKLLVFNISKKEVIKEIKVGTFSKSPNNFICIENEKRKSKSKILLCACKCENQKNGILLININFEIIEQLKITSFFYFQNFDINCICPITLDLPNQIFINKKDDIIIFTKYFLVAGMENNNNTLKLYKLLFSNNIDNSIIEYDREFKLKSLERIKAPITCLFQSKKDERLILITQDGYAFCISI